MKKNKKILFYRNDYGANINRQMADGYGGVGYYRIIKPSQYLKGYDVNVIGIKLNKKGESAEKRWSKIFSTYDVFWTTYFHDPHEASQIFFNRDKYGKKVVIDLDDNFLDIDPTHPLYDTFKPTKKNRAFTSTILSFADVITCSTEPLKQRISEHIHKVHGIEKKIIVVPNMNDLKDWNFKPVKKDNNKIVIGYTGSNSHFKDLEMVFPAIAKVMDKYKNVHFEVMGSLTEKDAIKLFSQFSESARNRCDLLPPTWTFKDYPKEIAEQKWDIGICPLIDSAFTRSKSHIKFLEYSSYKIPVIASRVYPYYVSSFGKDIIKHEETGLLCKPSEWESALERLILDKNLRKQLGNNAYEYVKKNWQYNTEFSDVLDTVIKAL